MAFASSSTEANLLTRLTPNWSLHVPNTSQTAACFQDIPQTILHSLFYSCCFLCLKGPIILTTSRQTHTTFYDAYHRSVTKWNVLQSLPPRHADLCLHNALTFKSFLLRHLLSDGCLTTLANIGLSPIPPSISLTRLLFLYFPLHF